jgi:hypothetical protein
LASFLLYKTTHAPTYPNGCLARPRGTYSCVDYPAAEHMHVLGG